MRFTECLVRATKVRQAYAAQPVLATLPMEYLPPIRSAPPPLADEARYLLKVGECTPEMYSSVLPGALYHASGNVMLAGRGRILLDTDNTWREHPDVPIHEQFYWKHQYLRRTRRIRGATFAFRSPANNYYHTLADNLPRLFWLHQTALRGIAVKVLIPGAYRPWESYYIARLLPDTARVLQVSSDYLWAGDEPIFGSYLGHAMSGHLPRSFLDFFLPRVLPQRARQRHHRIYITRRQAPGGRRVLNEAAVVELLARYGFTPILLESLDVPAQIELFYDAEAVVAPHGAGLANLLFSEAIDLVELHPAQSVMPHYYYMARAMGHRYHYLCARERGRHDSFAVDIPALARTLDLALFAH
jgi:capsular polysaccharide biosynthesis protein